MRRETLSVRLRVRARAVPRSRAAVAVSGRRHEPQDLDLRRGDLEIVGEFGRGGRQLGQMLRPHGMSIDSKGNIYVGEASTGRRVQRFTPK